MCCFLAMNTFKLHFTRTKLREREMLRCVWLNVDDWNNAHNWQIFIANYVDYDYSHYQVLITH